MTCEEVRGRLDEWVEGSLGKKDRDAVAAHLAGCGACRAEAEALERLLAAAAGLPREIRPPRELWDSIDARLGVSRRPRRAGLPAWALAAAALALVVVTAAVTSVLTRDHGGAVALNPGRGEEEARFLAASQELLSGLEAQDLSPETIAIVRRNLEVIDAAIVELQTALERDPGNGELTRMLLATYQRKIDLLEQAARSGEG